MPPPRPQASDQGTIDPSRPDVTGFVFKVQANMDPQHRDRIAFMRMVSGTFKRGMKLIPSGWASRLPSTRRSCSLRRTARSPTAPRRATSSAFPTTAPCAWAIPCPSATTCASPACPTSRPEILRRVVLKDPTKTKQLRKALDDLSEEGVIQVFYPEIGAQWIVGVVGQLQLDVLISRLEAEYKVEAVLEPSPFDTARWVKGTPEALKGFAEFNMSNLARDRDGDPVFMARSAWDVSYQQERNPDLTFSATKER
jgi:peptide chain release factor 3